VANTLRRIIKPAPVPDVLVEQFDFLLAHTCKNPETCFICARLKDVAEVLLRPFAK